MPSRGPSEHGHERALRERGHLADRCDPDLMQPAGGDGADAPEPLDREGVEKLELAIGLHDEQAVGLGDAARHFREELRPRHADRDRQADPLADVAPQAHGDRGGTTREPSHPAHVEERLVDRHAFDERRRVLEDPVDRLARLDVGGHPRRDDDRVRAQAASRRSAHGRTDAVRLGFVARREHDSRADDHRPAAQARVVSLLDRRVERVDVGVENRRLG